LRSSAVSDCQNTFIAKTTALIERFAFLRASPRWIPRRGTVGGTQGRIWGQWDAPPLDFMNAASEM